MCFVFKGVQRSPSKIRKKVYFSNGIQHNYISRQKSEKDIQNNFNEIL